MSDLNLVVLNRYLEDHLPDWRGTQSVERLAGGQSNPTYVLTAANGARAVLRKKPAGVLLPSAHAVEREYRVIAALQGTGVPVAPALHLCERADVLGTPFYVMGYVAGRVLWNPALPELTREERVALYDDINRATARLHSLDPSAVGLGDYGKAGNYLARQIARWSRQYRDSATVVQPAMDRLIEWLPDHVPPSTQVSIVHGDLRLDNLILHPKEPRVLAIVDWELSTLGDPLADLSYQMLPWYLRSDEFRGMAEVDITALGIPDAASYRARYASHCGRPAPSEADWEVYLIFNLFRLAAILQGIAKREEEGTAASAAARETGALARPIGELAWRRARERLGAG
jgi:aminoglycoside phosphotransferase (APT) family kinase protein